MELCKLTPESVSEFRSVLLVCNDAGGAELVSRLASAANWNICAVVDGPALVIFKKVFGSFSALSLEEGLERADVIVTGSGWSSDLEYDALVMARARGIPSVVVLDHWVNYAERFIRNGVSIRPDTIWVTDADAFCIATHEFPSTPIFTVPNLLFEEIRNDFLHRNRVDSYIDGDRVLVVCEPISDHYLQGSPESKSLGYDEVVALRFLLQNINSVTSNLSSVVIRPHPSERETKYAWVVDEFRNLPISVTGQASISEAIQGSNVVIGCESMAMVLGLMADRRVISMIPPGGRKSSLPHSNIESLVSLIEIE